MIRKKDMESIRGVVREYLVVGGLRINSMVQANTKNLTVHKE